MFERLRGLESTVGVGTSGFEGGENQLLDPSMQGKEEPRKSGNSECCDTAWEPE